MATRTALITGSCGLIGSQTSLSVARSGYAIFEEIAASWMTRLATAASR